MLFDHQYLEELEDRSLAPYATRSKFSRGRKYPEPDSQLRTCFQRDRDRIIHTSAFRRLEYKTQVFITYEGDYYRTRLTHTLEVTQIGRTIARALGANEDLVEAICLAHDLGHPPFGHSGEKILNSLMHDYGGFEHNRQSYRIVTELERRYPQFPGLNLTWEVLEGIVKHETRYDKSNIQGFNPDLRGHLEAQIVNVADELAYTAHDLDDGLRSGMVTPAMLKKIELWQMVSDSLGLGDCEIEEMARHVIIRQLIGLDVSDVVKQTLENIQKSGIKSVDELQRLPYNVVAFSETLANQNHELKNFLYHHLYQHYRVVRMALKAERIISTLFNAYIDNPKILPEHYQAQISIRGIHQTVCDYVAGMTDRYCIEEYQKLVDPKILP